MNSFLVHLVPRVLIGLLVLLLAIVIGCSSGDKGETQTTTEKSATQEKVVQGSKSAILSLANPEPGVDPVCGMEIDGSLVVNVDGKEYGFCSQQCADKFKENPEKYLAAAKKDD